MGQYPTESQYGLAGIDHAGSEPEDVPIQLLSQVVFLAVLLVSGARGVTRLPSPSTEVNTALDFRRNDEFRPAEVESEAPGRSESIFHIGRWEAQGGKLIQ